MKTDVKSLRCGECGEAKHLLYTDKYGRIFTECTECGTLSEIKIVPAKIEIDFVNESPTRGRLAQY